MIPSAIEELLRYDAPGQRFSRMAREDLDIAGHRIPRDTWVYLVIGAANRDPSQFPGPDRLDVTRTDVRHLSFGLGRHNRVFRGLESLPLVVSA